METRRTANYALDFIVILVMLVNQNRYNADLYAQQDPLGTCISIVLTSYGNKASITYVAVTFPCHVSNDTVKRFDKREPSAG